jgi:hypothetical protein
MSLKRVHARFQRAIVSPFSCGHRAAHAGEVQVRVTNPSTSLNAARRIGPPSRLPDLRWSGRIASAKYAIEVGKIAEPDIKRHRADIAIDKLRIAQDPVRAREALAEHER